VGGGGGAETSSLTGAVVDVYMCCYRGYPFFNFINTITTGTLSAGSVDSIQQRYRA
jgi:hypothetical protein